MLRTWKRLIAWSWDAVRSLRNSSESERPTNDRFRCTHRSDRAPNMCPSRAAHVPKSNIGNNLRGEPLWALKGDGGQGVAGMSAP